MVGRKRRPAKGPFICFVGLLCSVLGGCNEPRSLPPGLERLPPRLAEFADDIERAKLPHVAVTPVKGSTKPWESKLLGVPYFPKDRNWPTDPEGKALVMLAQINFAEMPPLPGYPRTGILQFYISPLGNDTQVWGMRIDAAHRTELGRLTDQSYFRVVYFPDVTQDTRMLIAETPAIAMDEDYGFPVAMEARLLFALESSYVRPDDYRFQRVFGESADEFFDFREPSRAALEDEYVSLIGGLRYNGRVGGYSRVEQTDPRLEFPDEEWLVLFSLDSLSTGDYSLLWADDGIGNFYIRRTDLARQDFSKVMYYWDCG